MTTYQINTVSDQHISEFVNLKESFTPEGYFVAESEKVVLKLLSSHFEIIKIFCSNKYLPLLESLNIDPNIPIFFATPEIFKTIIGINLHQGIMALVKKPQSCDLFKLKSPLLILNAINKAENVGALIRSSTAFGFNSILCDSLSCSPYNRKSTRVSMGNVFSAQIANSRDLVFDIKRLQEKGIQVVSAANESNAHSIAKFNFKKDCAIIIGNEGHGISKDILEASDAIVKIPIDPRVAHINASHAGAIFFYEYSKRFYS